MISSNGKRCTINIFSWIHRIQEYPIRCPPNERFPSATQSKKLHLTIRLPSQATIIVSVTLQSTVQRDEEKEKEKERGNFNLYFTTLPRKQANQRESLGKRDPPPCNKCIKSKVYNGRKSWRLEQPKRDAAIINEGYFIKTRVVIEASRIRQTTDQWHRCAIACSDFRVN